MASACNSDSRYGWPLSGARLVGAGRFTASKAIRAASSDSWADKGGSSVSELTWARQQPGVRYYPQRVIGLGYRMIRCGMHASSITHFEPVGVKGTDARFFKLAYQRDWSELLHAGCMGCSQRNAKILQKTCRAGMCPPMPSVRGTLRH